MQRHEQRISETYYKEEKNAPGKMDHICGSVHLTYIFMSAHGGFSILFGIEQI